MMLPAVLEYGLREWLLSFYYGCNSTQVKVRGPTCDFLQDEWECSQRGYTRRISGVTRFSVGEPASRE